MRKGREIVHLPVVNPATGETLGQAVDLVVDPGQGKITALLIQPPGGTEKARLPLGEVELTGDMVRAPGGLPPGKEPETDSPAQVCISQLTGLPVVTRSGKKLGQIGDLVFNSQAGEITGLEVSDGLVQDLLTGRVELPWPDVLSWEMETVIVADHWHDAWRR
ncbi:MAG: PRC-barrel domain-containing protein [Heliobacteriaceae bacterium]|nr:PRC-barrel domain-containing protein [Heliobacteriaceae bacterium]MDD4587137.1 PRC-barrel domain-containing protein [Heliobacteriaceae bacterium]